MTHAEAMVELLVNVACSEATRLGRPQVIGHGCGWSVGSSLPESGELEELATIGPGEDPEAALQRVREALDVAENGPRVLADLPGQLKMF